jgi:DNA-binding MarR family transcriptional regulator
MPAGSTPDASRAGQGTLGRALRRGLVGYWLLVGNELAGAGFPDRRFPDGRVLVMCSSSGEMTISEIGRRLGVTRQRAGKIVAGLRERGYVNVTPSASDGREKVVTLTPRAEQFLLALREATRLVEERLAAEIGPGRVDELFQAMSVLARWGGPLPGDWDADRPRPWLFNVQPPGERQPGQDGP